MLDLVFFSVQQSKRKDIVDDIDIIENIKNENYEFNTLNLRHYDVCILPNDLILISNHEDKCLSLYNKYFDLIQIVDTINKNDFCPLSITSNNYAIIQTDLEFREI